MIKGMFDYGALPVLERMVQFAGARHKVLADNVANISTPYFKPRDLDPASFQATLRYAIDERRESGINPVAGKLEMRNTRQLNFQLGRINIRPEATNSGILFHDQNNRDLERIMQHLAENTLAHNAGIEMIRNELGLLRVAISGRV
jgi:flagellar basal-body rod protein FlgB